MCRAITTLALALGIAGCGLFPVPHDPSPSGAMAHMSWDLGWENCPVELWVTGVIVQDKWDHAAIRDDQGVVRQLVWGTHNTGVVDWGGRYRIGGRWFNTSDTLWACGGADAVIPE